MVGSGGIASPFLTSPLDGVDWSFSRSGRFTRGTHSIGGWMGRRADMEGVNNTEILPSQRLEPRPSNS
jgi:hypothetical protein